MKRTRVPKTKALLHASHPGKCPDCGSQMVTAVDKEVVCHVCERTQIADIIRSNGRPRIYLRDVPLIALYPNRAARRRAGL